MAFQRPGTYRFAYIVVWCILGNTWKESFCIICTRKQCRQGFLSESNIQTNVILIKFSWFGEYWLYEAQIDQVGSVKHKISLRGWGSWVKFWTLGICSSDSVAYGLLETKWEVETGMNKQGMGKDKHVLLSRTEKPPGKWVRNEPTKNVWEKKTL